MKNKKLILTTLSIIIVVAAAAAGLFIYLNRDSKTPSQTTNTNKPNTIDYGPPKETDKIQPSAKDDIIDGNTATDDGALTITQAVQQDSTVYIRTIINGFNGGSCDLTLTNGSAKLSKTAPIGVQASYAVCQGFNIPTSEFSVGGTWKATIVATNTAGKQVTAQKSFEVTK